MNTAIYSALCACFGLSPTSAEAALLIREAYQEPENNPRPPRSADVIYYSAEPDTAAGEMPPAYALTRRGAAFGESVDLFAAFRLLVVCYGPHALENARKIRAFLFVDGANCPRSILRQAGLYPVPQPPEPLLLREPEGSLWRQRADLAVSVYARETLVHAAAKNAIRVAPAVIVHSEESENE